MSEWISMKDRMPEFGQDVACLISAKRPVVMEFFTPQKALKFNVTHWMPLPAPPREEGSK